MSYFSITTKNHGFGAGTCFKKLRMNKIDLFLDSGAFSAWSKNVNIDIQEYIKFIKKNKKYIETYANLDVIGNPRATLKNQKIMEKAGLKPLPTFHVGSDVQYLEYYIENYDYIAIGGIVSRLLKKEAIVKMLDYYFSEFICDTDGFPSLKVHGFGVTNIKLITRYPWYSVDSTSWIVAARTGMIYVPIRRKGYYRYDLDPIKMSVSVKSPNIKKENQHVNNLSPEVLKDVIKYIKMKGFTLTELANDYRKRGQINVLYFIELEKFINKQTNKFKRRSNKGFNLS